MINYDDFKKVEMRVGQIVSAEKLEDSEKLMKLEVDFKEEKNRQVISGISKFFESADEILGKKCVFVTNLEPREIFGFESQAMILGVLENDNFAFFEPSKDVEPGSILG